MKTSNQLQNLNIAYKSESIQPSKPRIGDDDGISNRAMNLVIVLFTLITIGISLAASAQQPDSVRTRILLRQAMLDMDREHYDKAVVKLLEVRAANPENANVNQMLGKCFLHGSGEPGKAIFYFNKAVDHITAEHEEWDLDETRAPLETAYLLAQAYEQEGRMAEAAASYERFIAAAEQLPMAKSRTYALIAQSAQRCRNSTANTDAALENVVFNNNSNN